jgi:hypothetical protein
LADSVYTCLTPLNEFEYKDSALNFSEGSAYALAGSTFNNTKRYILIRAIDRRVHLLIRRETRRRTCELELILGTRLLDLTNASGRILVLVDRINMNIGVVFGHVAFLRFTRYCRLLEILCDTEILLQVVFVILHSVAAAFTQIHF